MPGATGDCRWPSALVALGEREREVEGEGAAAPRLVHQGARSDVGMYMWTPGSLEHQLTCNLRQTRDHVPEGMKRQAPPPRAVPPSPLA